MLIPPSSKDIDLNILLNEVETGKAQLPEFQRSWTWDDYRIRGLLSSLTQGYPMGAIMRLAYGNPEIKFKYRTIEGVGTRDTVPDFLILDGQQRMTTIYQSTYSKDPVSTRTDKGKEIKRFYYLDIMKCLDPNEDRDDAIVAVPEDRILKTNFDRDVVYDLSSRDREIEELMFPANILFDQNECLSWGFACMTKYGDDPVKKDVFARFNEEVLRMVSSYKLPVITLDRSTPRVAVCKVFENVNTGGIPLTVFELVTAMFATYEFDLRADWQICRTRIVGTDETLKTDLLDGIDETAFLTSVTLYTSYMKKVSGEANAVSCKKKDVLALEYSDYIRSKEAVLEGFESARNFLLTNECVYRRRDLPYATQIIPLSAICAVLGKHRCMQPNVIKVLEKWYWCGILGEMYGGANETRYANDIEDVIEEIEGKSSQMRTVNSANFSATRLLTLQTRNSAAYKGIMALLYKAKCQDFMNGTEMNVVNCMTTSPDIHHIFPEKYCRDKGIARERYNCIVNKTPILYSTNRYIGGDAPSIYIERILKAVDGLDLGELARRVTSHQIDFQAFSRDDFDVYFTNRAGKILDLIELAMGKPVADRAGQITVERFGQAL